MSNFSRLALPGAPLFTTPLIWTEELFSNTSSYFKAYPRSSTISKQFFQNFVMWTVFVPGGPKRVNHAAVAIGDKILSFGGYCSGETMTSTLPIDIHELSTDTFRWKVVHAANRSLFSNEDVMETNEHWSNSEHVDDSKLSEEELDKLAVPYQRYGHTVVAYQGKAYLWGGRNDEFGASAHLHEFDPVTRLWRYVETNGFRPPARDGHTAVIIKNRMYLFGGFEEEAQRFSQETYYFDFATSTWYYMTTHGDPPLWRDFHTAVAMNEKMYVFGGRSDQMGQYHSTRDTYCNNLKVLDINTKQWELLSPTSSSRPLGRRSHSAWSYGGKMYIFGGYNGTTQSHYDELWCYDPATNSWDRMAPIPLAQPPCARRRQCTVVIGTKVFLFGGTTPEPANANVLMDLSDLYVFDYSPSLFCFAARTYINHNMDKHLSEYITRPVKRAIEYMTEPNKIGIDQSTGRAFVNG